MRVTTPMILRATEVLMAAPTSWSPLETAEACLRAALNDPVEPERPMEGQTSIGVDNDGNTVVVHG